MKNVFKKTCAIVMMTAVLFTAAAPKPVLATCAHPHPPVTEEQVVVHKDTHTYNGKVCTITTTTTYQIAKCRDCGTVFNKTMIKQVRKHSVNH